MLKGTVSLDNQPRCPRITIGSRGEVVNYLIFAGILLQADQITNMLAIELELKSMEPATAP